MSSHRVVGPAGHISDHHVGHRHDLTILGLFDKDGDSPRNELTVKLNALSTSDELPITVVTCDEKGERTHTLVNINTEYYDMISVLNV